MTGKVLPQSLIYVRVFSTRSSSLVQANLPALTKQEPKQSTHHLMNNEMNNESDPSLIEELEKCAKRRERPHYFCGPSDPPWDQIIKDNPDILKIFSEILKQEEEKEKISLVASQKV